LRRTTRRYCRRRDFPKVKIDNFAKEFKLEGGDLVEKEKIGCQLPFKAGQPRLEFGGLSQV
jgi:hypothetical protein